LKAAGMMPGASSRSSSPPSRTHLQANGSTPASDQGWAGPQAQKAASTEWRK
jgi:hypothetical protein